MAAIVLSSQNPDFIGVEADEVEDQSQLIQIMEWIDSATRILSQKNKIPHVKEARHSMSLKDFLFSFKLNQSFSSLCMIQPMIEGSSLFTHCMSFQLTHLAFVWLEDSLQLAGLDPNDDWRLFLVGKDARKSEEGDRPVYYSMDVPSGSVEKLAECVDDFDNCELRRLEHNHW